MGVTRPSRWAWVPIPVLGLTLVGLWAAELPGVYDWPWLLLALSFVFATLAAGWMSYWLARSFLASGRPALLWFICGIGFYGLAGVAATVARDDTRNTEVTIHNVCVWWAALCHLLGAMLAARSPRVVRERAWWLVAGGLLTLAMVALVVVATRAGLTPLFFVQGQGGTPVRQTVLGAATLMLVGSAWILRQNQAPRTGFVEWYGGGLLLIALGLFGLLLQSGYGSVLGWVARGTQWLSSVYLIMATVVAARETGARAITLAVGPRDQRLRYLLAVVFVAAGVVVRLVFLEALRGRVAFATFFPAVMLAALYGGRGPGLLALGLSTVSMYFFSVELTGHAEWLLLALYLSTATVLVLITGAMQDANARAAAAEAEVRVAAERSRGAEEVRAQRAELQRIADVTPVMLMRCRRDLRYVFVNRAYASFYGRVPEEFVGQWLPSMIGAGALAQIQPKIEKVLAGQAVDFEMRLEVPQRGTRHLSVSYRPDYDAAGDVVGWVASLTDITERKQIEEALRDSEARFRMMADAAPVMIWVADQHNACTYFNKAWLTLTGRTLAQEYGTGWLEGVHPEDQARYLAIDTAAFLSRTEYQCEYRLRRYDGEYRWIFEHGVPRFGANGEFLGQVGSSLDVTERRQAEDALRESEARFRTLAEAAPVLIWLAGPDKLCTYVNKSWLEFTGRTLEQELGNGWAEGVDPEDLTYCLNVYNNAVDARREFEMEYRLRRHDGEYRWILDRGVPRFTPAGEFLGYIGSCVDIHDRKLMEATLALRVAERTAELRTAHATLREREALLERLFQHAPDPIVVADAGSRIVRVNLQTEKCFGYAAEELIGQPVAQLVPERLRETHEQQRTKFAGRSSQFESCARRKDGSEFPVDVSLAALPAEAEDGALLIAVIRDLTERLRLEREIVEVVEGERERLGREVHDGLSQHLTGINFMIEALRDRLQIHESPEVAATEKVVAHLHRAVSLTHDLARGLFPVQLQTEGLATALRELAANAEEMFAVKCEYVGDDPVRVREASVARHLYRIAQEAVFNAVKHSQAPRVEIALTKANGSLTLTVRDEGRGFAPAEVKTGRMGLQTMKYRARMIGATLTVASAPGGGTVVTCLYNSNQSNQPNEVKV